MTFITALLVLSELSAFGGIDVSIAAEDAEIKASEAIIVRTDFVAEGDVGGPSASIEFPHTFEIRVAINDSAFDKWNRGRAFSGPPSHYEVWADLQGVSAKELRSHGALSRVDVLIPKRSGTFHLKALVTIDGNTIESEPITDEVGQADERAQSILRELDLAALPGLFQTAVYSTPYNSDSDFLERCALAYEVVQRENLGDFFEKAIVFVAGKASVEHPQFYTQSPAAPMAWCEEFQASFPDSSLGPFLAHDLLYRGRVASLRAIAEFAKPYFDEPTRPSVLRGHMETRYRNNLSASE